jgi:hypothetical protein
VTSPIFDRREQLEQIQSGLLEGEQVIAVYDAIGAGTGFLGLTDRSSSRQAVVGKKIAHGHPYARSPASAW